MILQSHSDRQSTVVSGVAVTSILQEALSDNVYRCVSVCEYMTQSQTEAPRGGMAVYCGFTPAVYAYRKVEEHAAGKWKEKCENGRAQRERDDREGNGGSITTTKSLYLKMLG